MKRLAKLMLATGTAALLLPGMAMAINVDGLIGDWGVSIPDTGSGNNAATHKADYSGVTGTPWESTHFEGDGYTTPGGGGQNYDAEFMALHVENNILYGVLMSGQRQDNGASNYSPGDIFLYGYDSILGTSVTFAIEVGGMISDPTDPAVHLGQAGMTYTLDGSGHTVSSSPNQYLAGDIVRDPNYVGGQPFNSAATHGDKVQMIDGGPAAIGTAMEFIFNQDSALGEHSIIEFAIDLAVLGLGADGYIEGAHWSPGCGNDSGSATPSSAIPEPTGALLMCVGLITIHMGGLGRRKA